MACAVVLALPAGATALWGTAVAALAAILVTAFARRRFGGYTGDVLGATAKLSETLVLVVGVATVT
jgi:adenosylcobinamide-GDP ribazoletransferase